MGDQRLIKENGGKRRVTSPSPYLPEPDEVRQLFDRLASRYDQFNRRASLGLDRRWRRALLHAVLKEGLEKKTILDLGTGTGDLLFDLWKSKNKNLSDLHLVGMDLSESMLGRAQFKFLLGERGETQKGFEKNVNFVQANVKNIPLVSNSVDVIMSAFMLRNVKKIVSEVLSEVWRLLVPGGTLFLLEMYTPNGQLMRTLHKFYLRTVLPLIGKGTFGDHWSGDYLAETILNFGDPNQFSELLKTVHFQEVHYHSLNGGIAILHSAKK